VILILWMRTGRAFSGVYFISQVRTTLINIRLILFYMDNILLRQNLVFKMVHKRRDGSK